MATRGGTVKGNYVDYTGGTKKTVGSVNAVVDSQKNNTTAQDKAATAINNVTSDAYNKSYGDNGGIVKTDDGSKDQKQDQNKVQNKVQNQVASTDDEIGGSPLWQDVIEDDGTTPGTTSNTFDYQTAYTEGWNAYKDFMDEQKTAQEAAIAAGVEKAVNSINAQKKTTAQDYADTYRQLYLQQMNAQKNINQKLAAQGLSGGAAESTLLGLETSYEDNLRQGKVAEQNALAALEQAIVDAQLSGSIESANSAASTAQQVANAYLSNYQNLINTAYNYDTLNASKESENKSYAYQIAMAMLNNGSMPSDTLLSSAGISKSDANTIVAQYQASKTASTGGGKQQTQDTTTYTSNPYGQYYTESAYNDAKYTEATIAAIYNSQGAKKAKEAIYKLYHTTNGIDYATYRSLMNKYGA